MKNETYGAKIERGFISAAANGKYAVTSISRDGVITPPISAIDDAEYLIDDRVYFFMFDDGDGMILGKLR